jgi:Flp pilus assembly protein TadG
MSASRLLRDRRGIAALEFAIMAPVLLLLLLATVDLVVWMRTWLRMEQATSEMTQIITQYSTLYNSDFTATFLPVAQSAVGGVTLACSGGGMAVTGIDNSSGTPAVSWQWSSGACATSSFTTTSGPSTTLAMPGNYVPPSGYSAIVVELFTTQPAYVFSRKIMAATGLSNVHTYAVAIPRSGMLPTLTAGNRPS